MSHHSKSKRKKTKTSKSSRHIEEDDSDSKSDDNESGSVEQLLSDLSKCKSTIKKKDARIEQLETEIEIINSKFNDAQERVEELEDINEKLESNLQNEKNKNDDYTTANNENDENDSLCKNENHKKTIKKQKDAIDKMELLLDEYKQSVSHYQTKYQEQQTLAQRMRQKYESLNVQFQQQTQRLKMAQEKIKSAVSQVENHYQQRIETMQSLNSAEILALRNQIDLVKRQQNENRSKESEDIETHLKELTEQHNQIEKDLQKQIDDTKEMMSQREKAAQQLVDQVNQQFDEYREMAENEITELKQKLVSYEIEGNIEILLSIEVDGADATGYENNWMRHHRSLSVAHSQTSTVIRKNTHGAASSTSDSSEVSFNFPNTGPRGTVSHRPPPKKPAPLLPMHDKHNSQHSFNSIHSRNSSNMSDLSNGSDNNENNNNNNNKDNNNNSNRPLVDSQSHPNHKHGKMHRQTSSTLLIPNSLTNVLQKANPLSLLSAKSMTNVGSNTSSTETSPHGGVGNAPQVPQSGPPHRHVHHQSTHSTHSSQSNHDHNGHVNGAPNNDILSRMKSKILTSFQQLPNLDSSAASVGGTSLTGHTYSNLGLFNRAAQTPTVTTAVGFRNGYGRKPQSVRSAVSAYSGGGSNGGGGAAGGQSPSGSIISGSDVDRYIAIGKGSSKLQIMMYQQDNAKLAENLKMAHQKNMVMKEQSERKYKQLQLTLQAERATWNSKKKEYSDRIIELERVQAENEALLKERIIQLQVMENELQKVQSQARMSQEQMAQMNNWQNAQQSASNRSLVQQVEHYRVQLSQTRNQLLAANNTMRQQNDQITKLKNKLTLEHKTVESLRNQLAQRETTSAEELLEQQVKLLKNQRRMLIHEVRDLREQNERLKNMVVTGGVNITADNASMFDKSKS